MVPDGEVAAVEGHVPTLTFTGVIVEAVVSPTVFVTEFLSPRGGEQHDEGLLSGSADPTLSLSTIFVV